MNTQEFSPSAATPGALHQTVPQDLEQALNLVDDLLELNDDPAIEPGELHGMSQMLEHAAKTWNDLRAGCDD
ncbi:MAG TPA: hypothetical protein VIU46_11725 [Gallionellaceae bacterium]